MKHETRNTNHGFYAFSVARLVPVGTEALQSFFSVGDRFMLKVMTPLWRTKHSSALVGDKSGGDRKAARAAAFQVFTKHETRITNHGFWVLKPFSLFFGRGPVYVESDDAVVGNKTLIRARRGQVGWGQKSRPVAAFLRVVARHGAAMARHGRPASPAPATRPVGFSPATNHSFPSHDFPRFPTISHDFPAFPGPPPPPPSADQVSTRRPPFLVSRPDCRAARSLLSCALWGGYGAA